MERWYNLSNSVKFKLQMYVFMNFLIDIKIFHSQVVTVDKVIMTLCKDLTRPMLHLSGLLIPEHLLKLKEILINFLMQSGVTPKDIKPYKKLRLLVMNK